MSVTITTRQSQLTELTHAQVDQNFLNLAQVADNNSAAINTVASNANTNGDSLNALQLANYAALRAYVGPRKCVYVTGYLATSAPTGISGMFVRDDSDTGTADNGGTVIVSANSERWKRAYSGPTNAQWFGAVGDGVTVDTVAIQAAIDYVNGKGGGEVFMPRPSVAYNLGTNGLTTYANVVLRGEVGRYAGTTSRGVTLKYSGVGNAIYGQNILDADLINLDIDMSAATGTNLRGVYLNGVWKSTLRHVTVRGMSATKGYSFYLTTNTPAGPWGGQHNLLEMIEYADGILRLDGSGSSDAVTTTVINTARGYMNQFHCAQVVAINGTVEQWPDGQYGYYISGAGTRVTMIGCDIENTSVNATAIYVDNAGGAELREIGTVWAGFNGPGVNRFTGTTANVESYGGVFSFLAPLVANVPTLTRQDRDANAMYVKDYVVATNVTGGAQTGYRRSSRLIAGAEYVNRDDEEYCFTKKGLTTSSTAAQTVWTIPIPGGDGLRISVQAHGFQPGDNWFSNYRVCRVFNNGALTINADAQETTGSLGQINFTASGTNLIVTWTPTTANTATPKFNMEIRGPWVGYS